MSLLSFPGILHISHYKHKFTCNTVHAGSRILKTTKWLTSENHHLKKMFHWLNGHSDIIQDNLIQFELHSDCHKRHLCHHCRHQVTLTKNYKWLCFTPEFCCDLRITQIHIQYHLIFLISHKTKRQNRHSYLFKITGKNKEKILRKFKAVFKSFIREINCKLKYGLSRKLYRNGYL